MTLYGIEFEMIVYTNHPEGLEWVRQCMRETGLKGHSDGSLRIDYEVKRHYRHVSRREWVTKPISNPKELFTNLLKNLRRENKFRIFINENPKKITENVIRIDFNKSTGTHIHYSDIMEGGRTLELKHFVDVDVLRFMENYIRDKCKYESIKKDMIRGYAKTYNPYSNDQFNYIQDRYNSINVGNGHSHGTIEFRLCNLRGVKTRSVIPALNHQVNLINKAVKKGWKIALKKEEKVLKQELKESLVRLKEIKKKIGGKNDMQNMQPSTTEVHNTSNENIGQSMDM